MFKTNGEEGHNEAGDGQDDTIIGSSIKIQGDLVSDGSITVEGEVNGNVKTQQNLRVGEKAKIVADVNASDAQIAGTVQGNVDIKGGLHLLPSARVDGDISASNLVVESGAVFNGKCSMTEHVADTPAKKTEEPTETDENEE
jgi:cytoskeletal protein CcmA (bactofilin family)